MFEFHRTRSRWRAPPDSLSRNDNGRRLDIYYHRPCTMQRNDYLNSWLWTACVGLRPDILSSLGSVLKVRHFREIRVSIVEWWSEVSARMYARFWRDDMDCEISVLNCDPCCLSCWTYLCAPCSRFMKVPACWGWYLSDAIPIILMHRLMLDKEYRRMQSLLALKE